MDSQGDQEGSDPSSCQVSTMVSIPDKPNDTGNLVSTATSTSTSMNQVTSPISSAAPGTKRYQREHRQRSLDEIKFEPTTPGPTMSTGGNHDCSSPPSMYIASPCDLIGLDSGLGNHSHIHHHQRHQHSIYARNCNYKVSSSDMQPRCCRHKRSSSCSITTSMAAFSSVQMPSAASVSPGRKCSIKTFGPQSTPPPLLPPSNGTGASPAAIALTTDGLETMDTSRLSPIPLSPRDQESPSSFSFEDHPLRSEVDSLPLEMSFTWIDMMAIFFSICSFMFDIGTDSVVAIYHLHNEDYWYFGLTAAFIIIPTLIVTGISLRWYVLDAREEGSPPISRFQWATRVFFLLLQLGPIIRYIDSLMYGLKFRASGERKNLGEQKKYFQYMIYEDTDATMLRLFECFMEAAPQLVLQLYIIAIKQTPFNDDDTFFVLAQVAAVAASLLSLSWSLVSYHRALRMSLPDKVNMSWQGLMVQFLWRIGVIAARMLALALFASKYPLYIGLVCLAHLFIMFIWIISMRTSFCDNKIEELGYNAVLAVMFIFCYFNPVDSPTRYRYICFYMFMFAENTILMSLFYVHPDSVDLWYRVPAMIGYFVSFTWGIVFMIIYYLCFHPTGAIRIWRDASQDREFHLKQIEAQEKRGKHNKKTQVASTIWINQGRVLHPRPAVPNIQIAASKSSGDHHSS